jgi:APA family basic amino acid/polyamine antiporter
LAYISYFVGLSVLIGPDKVLKQEDASVFTASTMLFGDIGAKIILVFVVISVIGTVNGITLSYIRMPYSLAIRNMIPGSRWLKKEDERFGGMPVNSAFLSYLICVFWMVIHYFTQKVGMHGDVSEIAIGISYLNYIALYIAVMRLTKKGTIKGKIKGYLIPLLATAGSLVILSGSISHPLFIYYFTICFLIILAGGLYYKWNKERVI